MARVLVLSATGYVGGRLVPRVFQENHTVRCLARNARKISGRKWAKTVEVFEGDILKPETLPPAFKVKIMVGDALDFWRVEKFIANRKLMLRAEMEVWG